MADYKIVVKDEMTPYLRQFGRQANFIASKALNDTANDVREAEKKEMQRVFHRPTRFTLNSLKVTPAKKNKLEAHIWFKDPPRLGDRHHYLVPEVHGGGRDLKKFEKMIGLGHLVPGAGIKLNTYGNVSGSKLVQILSSLRAFGEVGHQMNVSSRSARKNTKQRDFFVVRRRHGGLEPGVYQRTAEKGRGVRQAGAYAYQKGGVSSRVGRKKMTSIVRARGVKPIFVATRRPVYSPRFDFYGVAVRVVDKVLFRNLESAVSYAMRTAR